MSGNAHQRKVAAKAVASALKKMGISSFVGTPTTAPISASTHPLRITDRIYRVLDHSSLQTLLGILGGLVGVLLDGRYLAILGVWLAWSIYRSNALEGLRLSTKALTYLVTISLGCASLFFLGKQLNKSKPHVFTPEDWANAIKNGTPLPLTQQITNIYNSEKYSKEPAGEPRIDLSEWRPDGKVGQATNFNTDIVNDGASVAIDVRGTVKAEVLPLGAKSEDYLFHELVAQAFDSKAPKQDIPVGPMYGIIQPMLVPALTSKEQADFNSNSRVIYLGAVESYSDREGNRYISELCMYVESSSINGKFCNSHNGAKKLKVGR